MPTVRHPLTAIFFAAVLRRYFYSGWAFLIPYLAAYLLYYLTGWPVNPPADTGSLTHSPSPFAPPPLIHLYWALHAVHVILAAVALRNWWQEKSKNSESSSPRRPQLPNFNWRLDALLRVVPWALLALLFYIPGAYLEWPSDPWEHLQRITRWSSNTTVDSAGYWFKSAYLLSYSIVGSASPINLLFWLDFYYTGICLLLCWQYCRLARACGLGERASMIFVIAQMLLFGNNIFSFYRYYGISSSIYAQLGAIALTRMVLEWAAHGTNPSALRETTTTGNDAGAPLARGTSIESHSSGTTPANHSFYSLPTTRYSLLRYPFRPTFWHLPSLLLLLATGLGHLVFIAFNHVQGLGIAGLSISAIIGWRLVEWKRSARWWLIGGAISINALFFWFYPRSPIIEAYRIQGWLNGWYGFNILDLSSPAGDRMLQIISIFGVVNIGAALLLGRHNNIISWLTLLPVFSMLLPCVSIPFATHLAIRDSASIFAFHRILFSVSSTLALVHFAALALKRRPPSSMAAPFLKLSIANNTIPWLIRELAAARKMYRGSPSFCLILAVILALHISQPNYIRIWHSISVTPSDLYLQDIWRLGAGVKIDTQTALIAPTGISWVKMAQAPTKTFFFQRAGRTPADDIKILQYRLGSEPQNTMVAIIAPPRTNTTPFSIAALCSKHWLPQETSYVLSGQKELLEIILTSGPNRNSVRIHEVTEETSRKR